ncbi:glucosamine 6-phosphate acetyltransferase [Terfezia boudieri ATCC MYA-4762]|uniref:Glucosamine 6-phosphate N-acetyltransferase n=1 Tax=Terfezia boudieri ATCC MYA-4762 TaxID=1051890 RepID=A0A3N4LS63_9PEZI|nr:glucosamine 6-phosphate acetyltransferase [Terfezia boudieri ATCC MYA-4762]
MSDQTATTTTPGLFCPTLISDAVSSSLPEGYLLRPLHATDYHHGFLDVLRVLTTVGDISESAWTERYIWMSTRNDEYFVVVIEEVSSRKIVAVGSLIVEKKFLRNLGVVGHIEDISVAKEMQGKQFGQRVIQALDYIAEKVGCYKAILDCSEKNEGFYVKCGYTRAGVQMAHYYGGNQSKQ